MSASNPDELQNQESEQSANEQDAPALDNLVNISTVTPYGLPETEVVSSVDPKVNEPSLSMIGFKLSRFVLFIISGFILFFLIFLFSKNFDASNAIKIPEQTNIADSTYDKKIQLIKVIQEEKKNYRDFTLQIAQMVLLNLLLPVLTAILGYIFASNKNKE